MALDPALSSKADFAVIYIEEAHPTDGWMYDSVVHKVSQPVELHERVDCASILQSELDEALREIESTSTGAVSIHPPIYVDTMTNSVSHAFGAVPERLAILYNGKMVFLGGKGPETYSVDMCRNALENLVL